MTNIDELEAAETAALKLLNEALLNEAQRAYDNARNALTRALDEIDRRAAKSRGARLGDADE